MKFKAGDLVSCSDPHYFEQLGVETNCGLVLENKKSTYKIMFDNFSKGYWLSGDKLKKEETKGSLLEKEVSHLVGSLEAEAFDFERSRSAEEVSLQLYLDKVGVDQLEWVQKELGERLNRLECLPHLMAVVKLEIDFQEPS